MLKLRDIGQAIDLDTWFAGKTHVKGRAPRPAPGAVFTQSSRYLDARGDAGRRAPRRAPEPWWCLSGRSGPWWRRLAPETESTGAVVLGATMASARGDVRG